LTDVGFIGSGVVGEVGERPSDAQYAVVAAHGDSTAFESAIKASSDLGGEAQFAAAEERSRDVRVEPPRRCHEASTRTLAGSGDCGASIRRCEGRSITRKSQLSAGDSFDPELDVDAVEQRAGEPS
jgi:hypothetical protein